MANNPRLIGAVLTGGASRRMGRDKATLMVAGVSLVERAGLALAPSVDEVVAVGPPHLAGQWLAVADLVPGEGPLGAVISALQHVMARDAHGCLVLACDLPAVTAELLAGLVETFTGAALSSAGDGPVDVVLAVGRRRQPLCAVWGVSAIETLQVAFAAGQRSVTAVLESLTVIEVDVDDQLLINVNTGDDLDSFTAEWHKNQANKMGNK